MCTWKECVFCFFFNVMSWKYQLNVTVILYSLEFLLLYFLSRKSVHWCEWYVKVFFNFITIHFPFVSVSIFFFFFAFVCSYVLHAGGGNGNPIQCSCLENPRDGEVWWGLPSVGSYRVGHDWSNLAAPAAAACIACIYIDKCNILLHWFFYHYILSFFNFLYGLCFNVSFVW